MKTPYGLEYLVDELISKTFFINPCLLKQGGNRQLQYP